MTGRIGLVLEGGGMRGVYTGGVLEAFMERGLYFPYVIGVSAGACNAVSYLARQHGRNRRVTIDYVTHPDYIGIRSWLRTGSMFGMDFIFDRIPDELDPLDYEALFAMRETLVIATTDPETGEARYFDNAAWLRDKAAFKAVIRASSSLPFVSKPVAVHGRLQFDGGVADPIPVARALADGCDRVIVVLTKDASYRIKPFKRERLARWMYPRYPRLIEAMGRRERVYNDSMALVRQLEREGRAFVLQPSEAIPASRMEKKKPLLERLYEVGERDAEEAFPRLAEWMNRG